MFRRVLVVAVVFVALFSDQATADLSDVMFEGLSESQKTECLKQNSITVEEIKTNVEDDVVSENFLCFFKCVGEKQGFLDNDGSVNVDHIGECPSIKKLGDNKRVQLIECLHGVDKVTKCHEMEVIRKCITTAVTVEN